MFRPLILAVVSSFLITSFSLAQETGPQLPLPRDPSMWINSGPIAPEALEGKAAFLWFFEESCPTCRGKWPALLDVARKFEGKPIVFIAVNSGNPRPKVEQYIRGVNVPWPVIVDPTREVERAFGVGEITLQNIHQVKIITAEGRIAGGDWDNVAESAEKALAGAKWNIDPTTIPVPLKPAWSAIEFGDFVGGANLVKKGLNANKPEIKAGAEKLNEYVTEKMKTLVDKASQETQPWASYKGYQNVSTRFAGYEQPEEVATKMQELSADDGVQKQLAAQKLLLPIKKTLGSASPTARKGALNRLKKLSSDHAGTDAAEEAQVLAKQIGG